MEYESVQNLASYNYHIQRVPIVVSTYVLLNVGNHLRNSMKNSLSLPNNHNCLETAKLYEQLKIDSSLQSLVENIFKRN